MATQAQRGVGQMVTPEPYRPITPDAASAPSEHKFGRWCDGHYSFNGNIDGERGQNGEVERVLQAAIEQAEQDR